LGDSYLITGGAGFIGSNIAHRLVRLGHSVRIVDDFSTGNVANLETISSDITLIEGDIRDSATMQRACKGVQFVLHEAALPSVQRSVEDPDTTSHVNINGLLNVLICARDAGVRRLVFASSSSVYGETRELPKHEGLTTIPLSPYALSKLTGEHFCRLFYELYGFETFALRYFNVYGPRQNPDSRYAAVIPRFIQSMLAGIPPTVYGDGTQTRDFTFVDDVVSANLACCNAPASAAGRVYNIAGGNRTSILELLELLGGILSRDVQPEFGEVPAGHVHDSEADPSRALEALGWSCEVPLADGLQQTVDWFKQTGSEKG
jgi:nucleoside-diphosphate-sugar epimerase